ncbi:hypothetical protein GCM10011374_36420 [Kocuria dechangensis]|uniref:Uncharacterized protein n=1 Tax=Kocuria dechangensis TaxID=1176249 RepID=A0A917H5K8_9MICC|nr:hypothetical protein [Kocuria dechangensis]GGG68732.1 hypothetical protein GCM10011374_36420 [Kocuria dechangensis]
MSTSPATSTRFISTGTYAGPYKCHVSILEAVPAETCGGETDQLNHDGLRAHFGNAQIGGDGILHISTHQAHAAIRPTQLNYHQDGVSMYGFLTAFEGTDNDGNEPVFTPSTYVHARLSYSGL